MIAALYVDADGVYSGLDGVDLWPVARDARLYAGPHPVVAHPPCGAWGSFARSGLTRRPHFGHRARKPSWLYAHGTMLPSLLWGRSVGRVKYKVLGHRERRATPLALRDVLLALARTALPAPAALQRVVVQLEDGCWLALGQGDPPRTHQRASALALPSELLGYIELARARQHRPFPDAVLEAA